MSCCCALGSVAGRACRRLLGSPCCCLVWGTTVDFTLPTPGLFWLKILALIKFSASGNLVSVRGRRKSQRQQGSQKPRQTLRTPNKLGANPHRDNQSCSRLIPLPSWLRRCSLLCPTSSSPLCPRSSLLSPFSPLLSSLPLPSLSLLSLSTTLCFNKFFGAWRRAEWCMCWLWSWLLCCGGGSACGFLLWLWLR